MQAALVAPIFIWTRQAVAGKTMSGVAVATKDKIDLVCGETPACSIAFRAALVAISLVRLILGCDAAFFNTGASGDPLVARIDQLRQIVVGQHFFRYVTAGANDRDGALDFT